MIKSKGPRTEPWETPQDWQEEVYQKEKLFSHDREAARWQIWLKPAENFFGRLVMEHTWVICLLGQYSMQMTSVW